MLFRKCLLLFFLVCTAAVVRSQDQWLLVGTYTGSGSHGIYVYRFNPATAILALTDSIACDNPSYLCFSPDGRYVYSIAEVAGKKPGSVSAFAFNQQTGHLTFLNEQSSGGDHPCYVSVDRSGKWVTAANYTGGSLSILAINKDGSLQPAAQTIQHYGSGPLQSRQQKPHVHSTIFSANEKYLFAADLGTDRVVGYPFHANNPQPLDTTRLYEVKLMPASGPRHIEFHPKLPLMYVMEEMSGMVSVYDIGKKSPVLVQRVESDSISPAPDKGSADIHISPNGKFLYASHRGKANYISAFKIDAKSGLLTKLGAQSVLGETPRNFTIDVLGKYLLVANQKSNNIVCFNIDSAQGMLQLAGSIVSVPSPVCLKMIPVK